MNQEDFSDFFTKLLVEKEKIDDSANLFSLHKTNQDQQDQSPISESAPPPSTQDQADQGVANTSVVDTPFEEAVPLEDELAHLLDDIDD